MRSRATSTTASHAPQLLRAALFLLPAALCFSQTITVTSGTTNPLWAVGNFAAAQLTGGAGSDFTSTQTTAANWVNIEITLTGVGASYRVDVHRTDTTWNANLHLYIQRTDDGTGDPGGTITGPLNTYQEITTAATQFYTGRKARTGVKAQLQLQGLSATVGPHNFVTTVIFTITET
jgi:hypothetical protein